MKVSEFLNQETEPIILGAFFSRSIVSDDKKYIITTASFKKSSKISDADFPFNGYVNKYKTILNSESGKQNFWISRNQAPYGVKLPPGDLFFVLENNLGLSSDSFFNKLYIKLLTTCDWVFDDNLNESKKSFLRGFMELRGSIDTQRQYITQDYFFNSMFEAKKAWFLIDHMNVPYYVVNINFRELQRQFYEGTVQRNTQLRFDIFWYMENVGIMNEYKAKIFEITRKLQPPIRSGNILFFMTGHTINQQSSSLIYDRINYYSNNVIGKDVADMPQIMQLRSKLGFDDPVKTIRSSALVDIVRAITPDECMSCKDLYDIKDRSFKKDGRYYFEMHHMISLGNNKELDDGDNLVKLCPICHKTLKRGVASAEDQKEIIDRIYQNAPNVLDFAKHFFDTDDYTEIVERTYQHLK